MLTLGQAALTLLSCSHCLTYRWYVKAYLVSNKFVMQASGHGTGNEWFAVGR